MDKVGHGFATYTVGFLGGDGLMRWCGYKEKASVWIGEAWAWPT